MQGVDHSSRVGGVAVDRVGMDRARCGHNSPGSDVDVCRGSDVHPLADAEVAAHLGQVCR